MSLKLEIESQPLKKAWVGGHNKHITNHFPKKSLAAFYKKIHRLKFFTVEASDKFTGLSEQLFHLLAQ